MSCCASPTSDRPLRAQMSSPWTTRSTVLHNPTKVSLLKPHVVNDLILIGPMGLLLAEFTLLSLAASVNNVLQQAKITLLIHSCSSLIIENCILANPETTRLGLFSPPSTRPLNLTPRSGRQHSFMSSLTPFSNSNALASISSQYPSPQNSSPSTASLKHVSQKPNPGRLGPCTALSPLFPFRA
jgi:hypothetical protein